MSQPKVLKLLNKTLAHVFEHQKLAHKIKARKYYLRPSSFPYCALREFLALPSHFSQVRHQGLKDVATLSMGTAMHTAIQNFMALLEADGVVSYCNWRCVKCHTLVAELAPRPTNPCPSCGHSVFDHEEYEFTYAKVVQGHVDNVLAFELNEGLVFVLIDWKSTKGEYLSKKTSNPDMGYLEQLGTYWRALAAKHPHLTFLGAALVYFDKQDISKYRVVPIKEKISVAKLKQYIEAFNTLVEISSRKDADALIDTRPCTLKTEKDTEEHRWCKWRRICTSAESKPLESAVDKVFLKIEKHLPVGKP